MSKLRVCCLSAAVIEETHREIMEQEGQEPKEA